MDDCKRLEASPQREQSDDEMGQDESRIQDAADDEKTLTAEERLADEIRLRKFTEQVLDSRQQELEAQETEKKNLAAELDALRKELSHTYQHLTESRNLARSKEKKLAEAKDQIFRLQSARKDITEAEAVDSYRALCSNVQRWVENRMKGILDELDSGRLSTRLAPGSSTRFTSFMREAAKRSLDLDQSDVYHVISIIMNYLCLVFFSKSFFCPLDDYEGDATLHFINDLELKMSRLPRDAAHCREWRSETLTAVTSQQSFKARKGRYVNIVSEDLAGLVSAISPKTSSSDLQSSLRRTIVEPAADLSHHLHLAASVFSLKWPARGAWSRLEVYECLNLASGGMPMDLSGTTPTSSARQKVSYMFDVAPGLFVERVDGGKKLPLKAICRPTVLVFGGDGAPAQKPTVLRWLWDASADPQTPGRQNPARAATPRSIAF